MAVSVGEGPGLPSPDRPWGQRVLRQARRQAGSSATAGMRSMAPFVLLPLVQTLVAAAGAHWTRAQLAPPEVTPSQGGNAQQLPLKDTENGAPVAHSHRLHRGQ